jgi:hypothetical protein
MRTRKWTQSIASVLTSGVLLAVPLLAVLYLSPFALGSQVESSAVSTAKAEAGAEEGLLRLAQAKPEAEREESAAEVLGNWTYTMHLEVVIRIVVRINVIASFAGPSCDCGGGHHGMEQRSDCRRWR